MHCRHPNSGFIQKGFIGPVGDDLPSLTPLIFGLIMFFSAFTAAFNSFDHRNLEFASDIEIMKISKTMQSNGYIFSHENFSLLCSTIGNVNLNYVAGLSEDAYQKLDRETVLDLSFFSSGGKTFFCTNTDKASGNSFKDVVSFKDIGDKRFAARIYPIVVEDNKIVKPMHLVVIAWK